MKISNRSIYIIKLNEQEFHDLSAILAYISDQVNYRENAPQISTLKDLALKFWNELNELDGSR